MKKIGIWFAVALLALCMTAPTAFAQTNGDKQQAAAAESTQTDKTTQTEQAADAEQQDAEDSTEETDETADAEAAEDTEDTSTEADDDAAETADEAEEAEEATAPVYPAIRDKINALELTPTATGDEELDALIQSILEEIITPEMDTYEQVKACYDYLTGNMKYSWAYGRYSTRVLGTTTANAMFNEYGRLYGYGALALSTNSGQCNDYASGFILLTRAIGLNPYLVRGSTISAGGGYIRHYWAELELEGQRYVFDPQLEQSLAKYNKQKYLVFGKTYAEAGRRYVYSGRA